MKKLASIFASLFCALSFSQEIGIEPFATGLNKPVNIKNAGDERLFVAELDGAIEIVNADGSVNATPFLDINTSVTDGGGEQGLLGLAFHPNYTTNGYFYVNYINNSGNSVISRFTKSTSDANSADPASELVLLTVSQPYSNHNGGDLAFGNDGYLYIAFGDGGSAGDPGNRAQDLNTYLGKLLRIDVDNTSNGNNYAIPTDNPFYQSGSALEEIWAYGLRNPWKFSFDKQTHELWIADVGQNVYEEINMVAPSASGLNYGWRCYEGNTAYNTTTGCPDSSTLTYPIAVYTHASSGNFKCSITGGYRYRGTAQPNLIGVYFFADFCSNEIGMLKQNGTNWDMTFSQQYLGNGWTTFGEDITGEIYIAGLDSGNIYKIIDTNLSADDYDLSQIKMYPNPTKDLFTLDFGHSASIIKRVSIFNFQGQLIKTITTFDEFSTTIDTKSMASGLYWVEITASNGEKQMTKLVKN